MVLVAASTKKFIAASNRVVKREEVVSLTEERVFALSRTLRRRPCSLLHPRQTFTSLYSTVQEVRAP